MSPIAHQLLIFGTVLFLLSLLASVAMSAYANPRMGVSAHVAGLEGGLALWALGLIWQYVALPDGMLRVTQLLAVLGLYAIFASLLLAAVWGTSRSTPIAGAGHQGTPLRETVVAVVLGGGSLAILIAIVLVLWGLCAWKA